MGGFCHTQRRVELTDRGVRLGADVKRTRHGSGRTRSVGQVRAERGQPLRLARIAVEQPLSEVEQPVHAFGVEQLRGAQHRCLLLQGPRGEHLVNALGNDVLGGDQGRGLSTQFEGYDRYLELVGAKYHRVRARYYRLQGEAAPIVGSGYRELSIAPQQLDGEGY
jgi:hypothetical protein